ncbi:hypothetical protein ACFSM5_11290 [Lacibacterium aquatile]|uniref:Type II toxin-antitoxin system MqsR family toxin n=1 Tax=Lacibacterium aquatile TaxID=1168082 RepID=A0ABW5DUI6_9PROT
MDPSDAEIEGFLRRFQAAAAVTGINFWKTAKNDAFLTETGFTNRDIELLLGSLTAGDYSRGPDADDHLSRPPGEVWQFSCEFEGYDMYIKLKLTSTATASAECLSAHEAQWSMRRRG